MLFESDITLVMFPLVSANSRRAFLFLYNQVHMLHFALMLRTRCNNINTGGIDTGMPEYICELGNILLNSVKSTGKQMAQIVRKHLARRYVRLLTQGLHFFPYIMTADGFTISCDEYRARRYFLLLNVTEQLFL